MTPDDEIIAEQARRIFMLEEKNKSLLEMREKVRLQCICVGGPLNDNVLGFTSVQMRVFQRIMDATEE